MKKKTLSEGVKKMDVQSVLVGILILFSILTGVLGYETLSISNVMIFAIFCVMTSMARDLKEMCSGLVDDGEEE